MNSAQSADVKRVNWGCVVITCLALLVAGYVFLYPMYLDVHLAAARQREEQYVRTAVFAVIQYQGDHGDQFPDFSGDIKKTLSPYIKDPNVMDAMTRFVWNDKLSKKNYNDIADPAAQWVLYSKIPGRKYGYIIGRADGHPLHYSAPNLDELLAKLDQIRPSKAKHGK